MRKRKSERRGPARDLPVLRSARARRGGGSATERMDSKRKLRTYSACIDWEGNEVTILVAVERALTSTTFAVQCTDHCFVCGGSCLRSCTAVIHPHPTRSRLIGTAKVHMGLHHDTFCTLACTSVWFERRFAITAGPRVGLAGRLDATDESKQASQHEN